MLEIIQIKIEKIREYNKILKKMKKECLNKFLSDPVYKGALLYYLYLISDSCISLAEMIIKLKSLRTPQSYHEAIDILGENNIIPPEFSYDFAKVASFRNFLAHDYEKIDHIKICNGALNKLDDIETYLQYVEKALDE